MLKLGGGGRRLAAGEVLGWMLPCAHRHRGRAELSLLSKAPVPKFGARRERDW